MAEGKCDTGPIRRTVSKAPSIGTARGSVLMETVELTISASNLPDLDFASKSDPVCVLWYREFDQTEWTERGRTECIQNCLNPAFSKKFYMDYYYEGKQEIKLDFYDADSATQDLKRHQRMGDVTTNLRELVSNEIQKKTLIFDDKIKKPKRATTVTVVVEKLDWTVKAQVDLAFNAEITGGSIFDKCKPVLEIFKMNRDESYSLVYREMSVKKEWDAVSIPLSRLCNGRYDRFLKIVVRHNAGNESLFGDCTTTLHELKRKAGGDQTKQLTLRSHDKDKKWQCTLNLLSLTIKDKNTFRDYVKAGTIVKLYVALDFTQSNNEYHAMKKTSDNEYTNVYLKTMELIVPVLLQYVHARQQDCIHAYGFGTKHPTQPGCVDIFALTQDMHQSQVRGLNGLKQAYATSLIDIHPYAPSNISPLIDHVRAQAASCKEGLEYHVLLILTDGTIDDMFSVKQLLVESVSEQPMSIIIIGVGETNDFNGLSDVEYKGKKPSRDIVQCIQLSSPMDRNSQSEITICRRLESRLDDQFLQYCSLKNIAMPSRSEKKISMYV